MSKNKGRRKTVLLELNNVYVNSYNINRNSIISDINYNFYRRQDIVTLELHSENETTRSTIEFKAGIVDKDVRTIVENASRDKKRFKITIEEI